MIKNMRDHKWQIEVDGNWDEISPLLKKIDPELKWRSGNDLSRCAVGLLTDSIVFVAVDEEGKPKETKQWVPDTERERNLQQYAIRLMELRKDIETEMQPFLHEYL